MAVMVLASSVRGVSASETIQPISDWEGRAVLLARNGDMVGRARGPVLCGHG